MEAWEILIAVLLMMMGGSGVGAVALKRFLHNGRIPLDLDALQNVVKEAVKDIQPRPDTDPESTPKALLDLVTRLEAVEMRIEQVHEEALDYLRRGEGARNRARQLRKKLDQQDDEEEEELTPEQAREMLASQGRNPDTGMSLEEVENWASDWSNRERG